jgi:phosphate-selective porin OprO and OprP
LSQICHATVVATCSNRKAHQRKKLQTVNSTIRTSAIALAIATGWSLPALGQTADAAAVQQELAAMRAQMQAMAQRIDTLEGQLAATRAQTAAAASATVVAQTAPSAPTAKPANEITWDGGPKLTGKNGWSFKPRGRLQVDVAGVNAPGGLTAAQRRQLGYGTELRRAYVGAEGTVPGGFGYRFEADIASSQVDITDLYVTYKASPEVTVTLGQHKALWGLEEMTSDLFTSFMERAAFNSGFGFERRLGLSATYAGKTFLVQGGVFADNVADLNSDINNSRSFDARAVFMPKLGGGQLHIGGSVHSRKFNDFATTTRYRARPFVHTTDLRLVDTGAFGATGEDSYGTELAWIAGRFHATGESHWITAHRPGKSDPTFNGGYAELGYMLTDDVSAYKGGVYDRIRPKHPLGSGGMGALQLNARYDWLDLSNAGIVGGRQQVAGLSLLWIPTDYTRFILNYGHLRIRDAAVPAAGDRDYSTDSMGVRAQFDF